MVARRIHLFAVHRIRQHKARVKLPVSALEAARLRLRAFLAQRLRAFARQSQMPPSRVKSTLAGSTPGRSTNRSVYS